MAMDERDRQRHSTLILRLIHLTAHTLTLSADDPLPDTLTWLVRLVPNI